ncbi:hypothetical protein Anas_00065, partial [Armadillidium nasatum]
WVWLSDEGIFETFTAPADSNLDNYNNYFNWSMTYRTDSDVPIPYGRTVPIMDGSGSEINLDIFSKKSKTVAIMGSACTNRNGRWLYARALKSLTDIFVSKQGRLQLIPFLESKLQNSERTRILSIKCISLLQTMRSSKLQRPKPKNLFLDAKFLERVTNFPFKKQRN